MNRLIWICTGAGNPMQRTIIVTHQNTNIGDSEAENTELF